MHIGLDVGGTKILAGVIADDGSVADVVRSGTPGRGDSPDVVERALVDVVAKLRANHDLNAVGIGAAGFVGLDGVVRFAPHVAWRDEPLAANLERRVGLPVFVDNDANTTALAELRYGAAAGRRWSATPANDWPLAARMSSRCSREWEGTPRR